MATITVTELATDLDTDARTARKFLRSVTPAEDQPGKGGRWLIEKRDIRGLKSKFAKYQAEIQHPTPADAEDTASDDEASEV